MKRIENTQAAAVSVVLPVYNAEKFLTKCLSSLRQQDYPQKRVELIVVDDDSTDNSVQVAKSFGARVVRNGARHIERGKAIGIREAKNELILFLDADNYFPQNDWLKLAVRALREDRELVGVESARFHYQAGDPAANRYCALFGINDPMAFYLKRRDRLADWEQNWCLMGELVEDREAYWKVAFKPEAIPTIGSQGFLTRKSLIQKASHWPYYFHMDANVELIQQGHRCYAMLKQPVGHDHCVSAGAFTKKCLRNLDLFFKYRHLRHYTWETPKEEFFETLLSMTTFLIPTVDAAKGFLRRRDPAFFLHPWFSFVIPVLYGLKTAQKYLLSFTEQAMAKMKRSKEAAAASPAGKTSRPSQQPKPPEPTGSPDGVSLSLQSGAVLGVVLLVCLIIFSRIACKTSHNNPTPSPSSAPRVSSVPGVEDKAENGSPEAKNADLASIARMEREIEKYRAAHAGKSPEALEEAVVSITAEAISNSKKVVSTFTGKGGWLYCPSDGKVSVNLPGLDELREPSCQGYYALNGNLHDGSGNGRNGFYVGNKVQFAKTAAMALYGAGTARGFTAGDYVALPPSVFSESMRHTGTIMESVILPDDSDDFKVSIGSNHGESGDFMIIWRPKEGKVGIRIPTKVRISSRSSFVDLDSANNVIEHGHWYTIFVSWDDRKIKADLRDEKTGNYKTVINKTLPMDAGADFLPPSLVVLGESTIYNSFGWQGYVSNIGFYDKVITAADTPFPKLSACELKPGHEN